MGKEPACNAGDAGDMGPIPGLGISQYPRRKARQPIPAYSLRESHGQRSLVGTVQRVEESDMTEGMEHAGMHMLGQGDLTRLLVCD